MIKKLVKICFLLLIILIAVPFVFVYVKTPSHDRQWEVGQERLPQIKINGDEVQITNMRDFVWSKNREEIKNIYKERTFHLSDIEGVDVVISHFSPLEGIAHLFLNFRIKGEEGLSISVESRREVREKFFPLHGLLSEYELIYIVSSYRDVLSLRTDVRSERVYVYSTIAKPKTAQQFFLSIAQDVNDIFDNPTFYNTFTKNCSNTLADNVRELTGIKIPLLYRTISPGNVDKALYDLEIIERVGTFEETKAKYEL